MMLKEKIKVVITDLDGTLLNSDHKISAYTKSIFQELYNQNYLLIVATGRHHLDAYGIVATLDCPVYLVTSNGARIHSPENELLFSIDMESDKVKGIFDLEIDSEITSVLFKEHKWQTNHNNDALNSFSKDSKYLPEIVDFNSLEDFKSIKLFFTHDNHQKLAELKDRILEKSISFGDGFNDEKMLKSTGKALIMGNAPQSLMDTLPHLETISSNDNDGVAKYLSEKLLN